MIFSILYKSDATLDGIWRNARCTLNTVDDSLELILPQERSNPEDRRSIYQHILKLEGIYRSSRNQWTYQPIRVKLIGPEENIPSID